jgi:MYXO-CTERM domain-containing protein
MNLKTDLKAFSRVLFPVRWNGGAIFTLVLASAITLAPATAGSITGLFNTGVDNAGVVLANGATDTHYVLTTNPQNPGNPNAFVVFNGQFPFPPWLADDASCKWIGPVADQSQNPFLNGGIYDYQLTFTTSSGFVINGMWASDNIGTIMVSGGGTVASGSPDSGFTSFTPFSVSVPTAGTYTLDFKVNNGAGSPTGLRVAFTGTTMTPEPATMLLGAFGLLAVGLLRRRRD